MCRLTLVHRKIVLELPKQNKQTKKPTKLIPSGIVMNVTAFVLTGYGTEGHLS